jgi:hypothetical protein
MYTGWSKNKLRPSSAFSQMKTSVKLESPCIKDVVHETYLEFYAVFENGMKDIRSRLNKWRWWSCLFFYRPVLWNRAHEIYLEFYAEFKNEIKKYNDNNEDDGSSLFLDHPVYMNLS